MIGGVPRNGEIVTIDLPKTRTYFRAGLDEPAPSIYSLCGTDRVAQSVEQRTSTTIDWSLSREEIEPR
jgi:hypothetical protein